jgi:hypothetical protein
MMLGSLPALADTLVDHACPCYWTIPTNPPLRLSERRLPLLALFGPHAVSDLSPECGLKQTSADHSEFPGSRRRFVDFTMRLQSAPIRAPLKVSCAQPKTIPSYAVAAIGQQRHFDLFLNFRNFACRLTQISNIHWPSRLL